MIIKKETTCPCCNKTGSHISSMIITNDVLLNKLTYHTNSSDDAEKDKKRSSILRKSIFYILISFLLMTLTLWRGDGISNINAHGLKIDFEFPFMVVALFFLAYGLVNILSSQDGKNMELFHKYKPYICYCDDCNLIFDAEGLYCYINKEDHPVNKLFQYSMIKNNNQIQTTRKH